MRRSQNPATANQEPANFRHIKPTKWGGSNSAITGFDTNFFDCEKFLRPNGDYWTHRTNLLTARPELCLPSRKGQLEILETYLDQVLDNDSNYTLLDIRYNTLHLLNSAWYHINSRSLLLEWLHEQQIPVFHVVRRNLFHSYALQAFEVQQGLDSNHDRSIRLDPDEVMAGIELRRSQIYQMNRQLNDLKILELDAVASFDSQGQLDPNTLKKIEQFLATPLEIKPPPVKPELPIERRIQNFRGDIVPALRENGFGNLVRTDWEDISADQGQVCENSPLPGQEVLP